jgi:hypothetical protein
MTKVVEFYLFYIKKMACRGVAKGEDRSEATSANHQSSILLHTLLVSVFPIAHVLQTGVFLCPFAIQSKKFNTYCIILPDNGGLLCLFT